MCLKFCYQYHLHRLVTDSLVVIMMPGLSGDVSEHVTRIIRKKLEKQDEVHFHALECKSCSCLRSRE